MGASSAVKSAAPFILLAIVFGGCARPPALNPGVWLDRTVQGASVPQRHRQAVLAACPAVLPIDTVGWRPVAARHAPVRFRLPANWIEIRLPVGAGGEMWRGGPGQHFDVEVVRDTAPGVRAVAPSPFAPVVLRCGERISGRDAAIVLWRTAPEPVVTKPKLVLAASYGGQPSLVLRSGVELRFRSVGFDPNLPERFLTMLRTVRVE